MRYEEEKKREKEELLEIENKLRQRDTLID